MSTLLCSATTEAMENSVFVKVAEVIRSCETYAQLDTAHQMVCNAGRSNVINATEWDLLHWQCQKHQESITKAIRAA